MQQYVYSYEYKYIRFQAPSSVDALPIVLYQCVNLLNSAADQPSQAGLLNVPQLQETLIRPALKLVKGYDNSSISVVRTPRQTGIVFCVIFFYNIQELGDQHTENTGYTPYSNRDLKDFNHGRRFG